jgi:hypothetical protein
MLYYPLGEGSLVHVDMEDVGKVSHWLARLCACVRQLTRYVYGLSNLAAVNCSGPRRPSPPHWQDVQSRW